MRKKILFSIVCFRENYANTATFKDLLISYTSKEHVEDLNVFIFDNTDSESWKVENDSVEKCILKYHHNSSNVGISKAYNFIAKYAKENYFTHIVFLDQDTKLSENFYSEYETIAGKKVDIATSLIFENNKLLSPAIYKNYRSSFFKTLDNKKIGFENVSCINSGLLVNIDFFYKVGGYDERLRLDFCDHEFISRVKKHTNYLHITSARLEQDFSTDTNSQEKALFRYSLFIKDLKNFKKINKDDISVTIFVDLPHLIRLTVQYKSFLFIKKRFLK